MESVDRSVLEQLRDLERRGSPGAMARIVRAFLDDAPLKVDRLRRALTERDAKGVAMAAHTLKGGCSYVGAKRLHAICAQMESAAEIGDLSKAGSDLRALEAELAAVGAALSRELAAEQPG